MITCDWTFHPRPDADIAGHALAVLISALQRNGQIVGDSLMAPVGRTLRLTCQVPHPDALNPRHHSPDVQAALDLLAGFCDAPADCVVHRSMDPMRHVGTLAGCDALVLYALTWEPVSPVRDMRTGRGVPLYLPGLPPALREALWSWGDQVAQMDRQCLGNGVLRREAMRQLADPLSELNSRGRGLALDVEVQTGLPTWYYLYRDPEPAVPVDDATCPSCGRGWQALPAPGGSSQVDRFPFRCDDCRLVALETEAAMADSNCPEDVPEPGGS